MYVIAETVCTLIGGPLSYRLSTFKILLFCGQLKDLSKMDIRSLFPGPQNLIDYHFAFLIILKLDYTVLILLIKVNKNIVVGVIIPWDRNCLIYRCVQPHTRGGGC